MHKELYSLCLKIDSLSPFLPSFPKTNQILIIEGRLLN